MAPWLMYICTAKIIDDCYKRKNPAHYLFMSKQDFKEITSLNYKNDLEGTIVDANFAKFHILHFCVQHLISQNFQCKIFFFKKKNAPNLPGIEASGRRRSPFLLRN